MDNHNQQSEQSMASKQSVQSSKMKEFMRKQVAMMRRDMNQASEGSLYHECDENLAR